MYATQAQRRLAASRVMVVVCSEIDLRSSPIGPSHGLPGITMGTIVRQVVASSVLLALLTVGPAMAGEPTNRADSTPAIEEIEEPSHEPTSGEQVYRAGTRVAQIGLVTEAAGVVFRLVGADSADDTWFGLGGVMSAIGQPLVAGGSLRAADGLAKQGIEVSRAPGATGLTGYVASWGGTIIALAGDNVNNDTLTKGGVTLSLIGQGASVLGGVVQMVVNQDAHRRAGQSALPALDWGDDLFDDANFELKLTVVPLSDGAGLHLDGRF